MGCATGMVKYLVFIFNLIFALAGLALLGVGILYKLSLQDQTPVINNNAIDAAPSLVIAVGTIVFVISFFGCCGAVKESTCMLTTYAVILLALFIMQVAIGVFAFLQVKDNNGDFKSEIHKGVKNTFERYNSDNGAKESFNLLQQSLKCCGVDSPRDWGSSDLPSSCCLNNNANCKISGSSSFDVGCSNKLYKTLKDSVETLGYVALGLCATEVIAAIFSLCLTSSIRNERRRGGYA